MMVFSAIGDTGYNVVLLLHVLSAMVALAPVFVHPLMRFRFRSDMTSDTVRRVSATMVHNTRMLYSPMLIVTGLLGFALAGMSDRVYSLRQDWLLSAVILWILMNGTLHGVIMPSLKLMAAGYANAKVAKRLELGASLMSLLLTAQLALMIWKPGL